MGRCLDSQDRDRIDPVICLENWGKDRIPELNCGGRTAPGRPPVRISREAPAGGSLCTGGYSFYRDEAVTDLGIGDDLPGSGGDRFPYGLECVYDADEITIKRMEQNKRPDSEFLKELCSRYGLILKIYNRRLIVFSYENYEKSGAVRNYHAADSGAFMDV